MSIFRSLHSPLLAVSLLVAMCVVPAAAQSSPEINSPALQSADSHQLNSSAESTLRVDQYRLPSTSLVLPQAVYGQDGRRLDENVCYSIRGYRVARDSRYSDTTHPVGYSTCQMAKKFQVRSTLQEISPAR